jgi:excisionase family DNA binding protein
MTIKLTPKYIYIPVSTLEKFVQGGRIPGQKVGRHWRFRRETIDRWLDENPNGCKQKTP